ncbi:MAG: hypothetical protein AAB425_04775, partial [Bdellovibrionota bacterium]
MATTTTAPAHHEMHTAVVSPQGVWWRPAHGREKIRVNVAFIWCMILFAMMPLWHMKGGQNPSGVRGKVTPLAFQERVTRFISDYKVGDERGIPIVAPPPVSYDYVLSLMWSWSPILKLKKF